ncbi:hypothetical protein [Streptomyces specialis]|uniref:hypothetical protein n=1 Tax=Streptomyces specialis TaxID=498367 RepID=UPI00131E1545|nr:hypothetical protein [Streptomyces specialis]
MSTGKSVDGELAWRLRGLAGEMVRGEKQHVENTSGDRHFSGANVRESGIARILCEVGGEVGGAGG